MTLANWLGLRASADWTIFAFSGLLSIGVAGCCGIAAFLELARGRDKGAWSLLDIGAAAALGVALSIVFIWELATILLKDA